MVGIFFGQTQKNGNFFGQTQKNEVFCVKAVKIYHKIDLRWMMWNISPGNYNCNPNMIFCLTVL